MGFLFFGQLWATFEGKGPQGSWLSQCDFTKAELLQEGIFSLIHLFARDVLVMKKLEIEKTKPIFIISVLKVEY